MFNAMKYIRDLEAVGFERSQAEAQVQMVLDVFEGELVTKSDFALFQGSLNGRLNQSDGRMDKCLEQLDSLSERMDSFSERVDRLSERVDGLSERVDGLGDRMDQIDKRFGQSEERIDKRFAELELRIITRLGFLMVSCTSIGVAVLTWLIKAH